jgi:hypothetical protein
MHRAASEKADPMTFRPANFDPSIDPTADQVRACVMPAPTGRMLREVIRSVACSQRHEADDGGVGFTTWPQFRARAVKQLLYRGTGQGGKRWVMASARREKAG